MTWVNYAIAPVLFVLGLLILVEFRRWRNKRFAADKVELQILPPTGKGYFAYATKDEKRLTVKSPTRKDVKHTYFVDKQATWDFEYPMSDPSFTRVDIKRVIYKEGHMEPAVKRPLIIINKDGKPVETDVEIANPTLVALTKDADDLAVIIREVNGSQGIFGANTALVTFILCTLIFIASVGGAYFGYQTYERLGIIANAQGINLNPQPVPITPTPKTK